MERVSSFSPPTCIHISEWLASLLASFDNQTHFRQPLLRTGKIPSRMSPAGIIDPRTSVVVGGRGQKKGRIFCLTDNSF